MSKSLLSLIKPLHLPKPRAASCSPVPSTFAIKCLINDTLHILRTDPKWQESLEDRFYGEEANVFEVVHHVFDRIRDPELGLKFFDWASQRPDSGKFLDGFACSSLLKLLARYRLFRDLECLLELMKGKGLTPTREAWSVVVSAYADSGAVIKALELYRVGVCDYNCVPDVFACNSLLKALVKVKKVGVAKEVFDYLVHRGDAVDNYSVGIMVKGLCQVGNVKGGMELMEMMLGKGCVPNIVFYNILIDGCWKNGNAKKANALFKELKLKGFLPTLETCGTMINGFCKEGNFEAVDSLVLEMKRRGDKLNVLVCNTIVDAQIKHCGKVDAVDMMNWVVDNGCAPDTATYNILINALCKNGKVEEAEQLLEEVVSRKGLFPNKYSYTPLIELHCKLGNHGRAFHLLTEMTERGFPPDLVAFGALVFGLVASGEVDVALKVKNKMVEKGVWPDSNVYNVLMSGLNKKGRLHDVKLLYLEMLDRNVPPDAFVNATLVDGYTRHGTLDEAKKLFGLTIGKGIHWSTVIYNTMIKGFCKSGKIKDALSCMGSMVKRNHSPDEFTYSTIIDGYVKQNDMHAALEMLEQMRKDKFEPNIVTYTTLIDGFCRVGHIRGAWKILKEMILGGLEPNAVTYTIFMQCFCKLGKHAKACSFFELMLQKRCSPSYITFNFILDELTNNALTASFKLASESQDTEGTIFWEFFKMMTADGYDSRTAAYNYILICLCQHNMVETALQFCDDMRCKGFFPDPVSHAAILHGLCLEGKSQKWRDFMSCNMTAPELEIAIRCSHKMTKFLPPGLEPEALHILQNLLEDCMIQSKIMMQ